MHSEFSKLLFDQSKVKQPEVRLLACTPNQDLMATMAHILQEAGPSTFARTLILVPTQRVATGILGKLSEVFPIFPAP